MNQYLRAIFKNLSVKKTMSLYKIVIDFFRMFILLISWLGFYIVSDILRSKRPKTVSKEQQQYHEHSQGFAQRSTKNRRSIEESSPRFLIQMKLGR
jgi:uncharacterized MAPEG superfamily protein